MMDTQSPTFKPDEMDSADDETKNKLSSHTHCPENSKNKLCSCTLYSIRAATCDFQQCGIFTCIDSDEPMQPYFKL